MYGSIFFKHMDLYLLNVWIFELKFCISGPPCLPMIPNKFHFSLVPFENTASYSFHHRNDSVVHQFMNFYFDVGFVDVFETAAVDCDDRIKQDWMEKPRQMEVLTNGFVAPWHLRRTFRSFFCFFFFRRSIPRLFASFSSSMLAFLFFLHFVTFDRLFSFVTVYLCEILVFREGAVWKNKSSCKREVYNLQSVI